MAKRDEITSSVENAENIWGFTKHGRRAVKALHAQCRLLQELPALSPENGPALVQRAKDLVQAIAGMDPHLRTLRDVVECVEGYAKDIIEAGDELEDADALVRYFVCVDSRKDCPFEIGQSGTEHPTATDAFNEVHQVRRNHPQAYVARVIYQRCAEPVAAPAAATTLQAV